LYPLKYTKLNLSKKIGLLYLVYTYYLSYEAMYRNFKKKAVKKTPISTPIPILTEEYKVAVLNESYLGKKGYTIPKSILTSEDIDLIKKELLMAPTNFNPMGSVADSSFPVYRENVNKIYIPRFYGIRRYGLPAKSEITEGESTDISFISELRDYQNNIVNIYLDYVRLNRGGGAILEVPCGRGKTVMALKITAELKKKTLILVHKEFLMNQWIERIAQFLPSARVGKIQANTFEVEGKDIVIGMIQTMYSREFPPSTFDCFGLTIIDEVHRIGSEEFSKTLLKVVTPYMLGISATVERKDGLTKLLYMFIGDKIYTETRKDEDPVCIRGIEYISYDDDFNETEIDWKGTPKFSSMIKKICEFGPRSDFIIRVLKDLVLENEEGQIMVLAHNRSLLTYLYDAIGHQGFATRGYYVGGMKESALKDTEDQQIVLATYAMAAEALDIKTLSILVMVSPKTDIEQSVGRILRERHSNPIVVDIIDRHELFQNQWRKRKTFYRKCNYRIIQTTSSKYNGFGKADMVGWKTVFEPRENDNDKSKNTENSTEQIETCLLKLPNGF